MSSTLVYMEIDMPCDEASQMTFLLSLSVVQAAVSQVKGINFILE